MKTVLMMLAVACASAAASARPLVLEAKTPITPPFLDFAVAGDELIGTTWNPIAGTSPQQYRTTATLYRRGANGQWSVVRILAVEDSSSTGFAVGMTTTVAAIS